MCVHCKKIEELLIKRDIKSFAKSEWGSVEKYFDKKQFFGIHANYSLNPLKWSLTFPNLDDYRKSWLQQSYESIKRNYVELLEDALYRISSIDSIKIIENKAIVLKKINGIVKRSSGKPDALRWQSLYYCQFIKNQWKIIGFVGYLPLEAKLKNKKLKCFTTKSVT